MPRSEAGHPSPRAILLIGPVGSGKTAVAAAMGDLLDEGPEPYAVIDLDWLAWVRPDPASGLDVDGVLVANLTAVWATLRRAGVRRLVLARALERPAQLAAVRRALGHHVALRVVRLAPPPGVIEARLRARDAGARLAEHLVLARVQAAWSGDLADETVDDAGRPPAEVADAVLRRAGWR